MGGHCSFYLCARSNDWCKSLDLSSPWLLFEDKIKHFVQVFLGWFFFLRWRYRNTFILSRTSYWKNFPRTSRLTGSHPCDLSPFLSLFPQAHFHPQTTHTWTKQMEGITEQIVHIERKRSADFLMINTWWWLLYLVSENTKFHGSELVIKFLE